MKRLVFALILLGCDRGSDKPQTTGGRSEAVLAPFGQAPAAATTSHAVAAPTGPRAKLCEAELKQAPRGALPTKTVFSHGEAKGAPALGDKLPNTSGRWLWIDFFAGWCGPCKEEMPRIRAFEAKLAAGGAPMTVAFVSLDDDQRELTNFLEAQPAATGVRSAYWLREGSNRKDFFTPLRMKDPPSLPAQIFVDPEGQVRCIVDGAVEESDYAAILAIAQTKK